jgi:hypothetical protein
MRMRTLALALGAALALVPGLAVSARARQSSASQNPLQAVQSLQCSFTNYTSVAWPGGSPDIVQGTDNFSFQITDLNLKRHTGRVVGSNGSALVTAMLTPTGLNVIEQTPVGNFILTTVFATGATQEGRHFVAVHSRHLGDTSAAPTASQYYGACDAAR